MVDNDRFFGPDLVSIECRSVAGTPYCAAVALRTRVRDLLSSPVVLVVVTDGIAEARRREGDRLSFFGSRGVARSVRDALHEGRDPAVSE